MSIEIPCNDCNCIFSDQITFKIHLKNCLNNINNDPLNKYYCPACDRYFRFLPNLLRHQETKKHLDLINWNLKQLSNNSDSTDSQTNIKNIYLTRDIQEKDNTNTNTNDDNDDNYINIENNYINIENNFLISNTSTNNPLDNIEDDFLLQLQQSYNQNNQNNQKANLELQIIDNFNDYNNMEMNNININKEEEPLKIINKNEIKDNFLENLIKEREKSLNEFTGFTNKPNNNNIKNNLNVSNNTNSRLELNNNNLNNNNNNNNNIDVNDNDILNQIQLERQKQLNYNKEKETNNNNVFNFNQQEIPKVIKKEIRNEIRNEIPKVVRNQRHLEIKKEIIKEISKEIPKVIENKQKNERYPVDFKSNPIWIKLLKMVNDPKLISYNIILILSSYDISYFPIVCAFVLFVEELDNKKELRLQLINSLIQIENHLIKLIHNRQFVWNTNKNTMQCYNFINKLKLKEQHQKYSLM